ncbi:K02A2.6-like [Cordylochernes scorpioides]|uniref:60S ribosome subunit biogenesis protein NIP7 homolog n=1 Tax=Cordylochernes scorpioides TaxID=51811 RepID=A0ABY6JZC0_9ARAC|nr:K02A2.6-like [Cordylochernes scorpioides]
MRPLTEEETTAVIEKLEKFIGDNVAQLLKRPDGTYVFRFHRDRVFYCSKRVLDISHHVPRNQNKSFGVCLGKFTKSGKFWLGPTCLDYLARYAKKPYDPNDPCSGCGANPRHRRDQCPAKDIECNKCGITGHYGRVCRQLKRKPITKPNIPPPATRNNQSQPGPSNTVVAAGVRNELITITTDINHKLHQIRWLADPGSDLDLIPESEFLLLGEQTRSALNPKNVPCVGANGISLSPCGSFVAALHLNGKTYSTTVGVCKHLNAPLLSKSGCKALGLLPDNWPHSMIVNAITNGQVLTFPPTPVRAECSAYLPSQQKEPLYSDPPPSYPFQHVSCDLFSHAGYQYLVMVDRFSGWINVTQCGRAPTSTTVIRHLQKWMADYGIPEILTSDNGPQFSSQEFRSWTKRWNIEHSTSSPHFPQSNGLAEAAVKAIKYLISKTTTNGNLKSDTFLESLMEFRNTPKAEGRSPAQIVFGAPTRTKLPLHRSQFAKEWRTRISECDQRAQNLRQKALKRYNRYAKPLSHLEVGAIVLVQDHRTKHWTLLAEHKVWVKASAETSFLYGENVYKSGLGRLTEGIPQNAGVAVFSLADVPLGFGIMAKSTTDCRRAKPFSAVVFNQADVGLYIRDEDHII